MTEAHLTDVLEARARLITSGLAKPEDVVGCSGAEVEAVQHLASGALPGAYRAFLMTMGRGAGHFLEGTDIWYPDVLNLRDALSAFLVDVGAEWQLTPKHFVFAGHQGYSFLLFEMGVRDDPAVLLFDEDQKVPRRAFRTFSEWLVRCVEDEASAYPAKRPVR